MATLSRPKRWAAAVKEARDRLAEVEEAAGNLSNAMTDLQSIKQEYEDWKDQLPENLQSSALADKLEEVCALDFDSLSVDLSEFESVLDEADGIDLPMGFGRD